MTFDELTKVKFGKKNCPRQDSNPSRPIGVTFLNRSAIETYSNYEGEVSGCFNVDKSAVKHVLKCVSLLKYI